MTKATIDISDEAIARLKELASHYQTTGSTLIEHYIMNDIPSSSLRSTWAPSVTATNDLTTTQATPTSPEADPTAMQDRELPNILHHHTPQTKAERQHEQDLINAEIRARERQKERVMIEQRNQINKRGEEMTFYDRGWNYKG